MPLENVARGSALASWTPLWAFAAVFMALLVAIGLLGLRQRRRLLGIPSSLEAITGVPGWAASTLLLSIYGLVVAGYGFYTDVAWHVALGRDDELFTAPHTAIFGGLCMIAAAPVAGIVVATVDRVPTELRWGPVRIPWSLLPLSVLGIAAIAGFPIDELWHRAYGVDVTMWSPPHLIMILAASFSGLASWLVLADAGVRPTHGRWARGLHVVAAALTLQGLSSVQGEFSFGVPQWQQLYHPVLVCLAAGLALTLIRIVHGRWWALGIASGIFLLQLADGFGDDSPVETRAGAVYLGSALIVELVALILGTDRRLRFSLVSGGLIGTVGLAVEWVWNQGAHQPWTKALLPDAVIVGALAATAAAIVGTAIAGAVGGDRGLRVIPKIVVATSVGVLFVSLAIPGPRRTGEVTGSISLHWVDESSAVVDVSLEPPTAADNARWFTVGSWQWGGRVIAHMKRTSRGHFTSAKAIPLGGRAKSLLRLHRDDEMMAIAIRLPADPEYGLSEVPAENRTTPFVSERQYLQRESQASGGWLAGFVYALVVVLLLAWVAALSLAISRIARQSWG